MKNRKKDIMISVIVAALAIVYILYNTFGVVLAEKDILHFMGTTVVVPAVILIVYGILMGKDNQLSKVMVKASVPVIIVFAMSCVSMLYMYHTGDVFTMLANTVTGENVSLNINESITFGTVIQQALIFAVCVMLGGVIGKKFSGVVERIRN